MFSEDDDLTECTKENIKNAANSCDFAGEYCEAEGMVDWYSLNYCNFYDDGIALQIVGVIIYLLLIILCFYILGSTADAYLSPALEKIASSLGMSESLAGVTLLALGNGSPDVISSLSAANSDSGGMFLAVGSLVGGGMFVSGVVSAIVLLSSPKPVKVAGMGFLRDTLFYIVSLLVLVIAAIVGELSFYFAITFFVIYIIFVISVIIIDRIEMKRKEARKEMRATIAQKRSTIGAISNKEQQMLDTADYDEDAYYYKDELDNLVEVEIEVEDYHEEEKGEFSHRFDRMMTEIEESMKIDYEDEEGSTELDNPKNGQNNDLKPPNSGPNLKVQNNDSLLSSNSDNKDKELRYSLLPKIQNMQTQIETQNNLTASQKSRFDAELTDKIDKTKIEPSKNLSSFI